MESLLKLSCGFSPRASPSLPSVIAKASHHPRHCLPQTLTFLVPQSRGLQRSRSKGGEKLPRAESQGCGLRVFTERKGGFAH